MAYGTVNVGHINKDERRTVYVLPSGYLWDMEAKTQYSITSLVAGMEQSAAADFLFNKCDFVYYETGDTNLAGYTIYCGMDAYFDGTGVFAWTGETNIDGETHRYTGSWTFTTEYPSETVAVTESVVDAPVYTPAKLGQGYAACTTAAATAAKTASISGYALETGGIVSVRFTYAVPANATLNISGKGAKSIRYNNAAITAGVINAGDTATLMYSGGYYHLICIDRAETTAHKVTSITSGATDAQYPSAKAVYDMIGDVDAAIDALNAMIGGTV